MTFRSTTCACVPRSEVVALAQSTQFGMPGMINPQASVAFQASKETKKISINEANPDHTVIIGAGLDEK